MATEQAGREEEAPNAQGQFPGLNEVLARVAHEGGDNAGACLRFETIGDSTIINIDIDESGPAAHIAVLTLAHAAGKTLQDVLNDIH